MDNSFVETLVGGIVIAIAAAFLAYGYSVSDVGGVSGIEVTAEFDRVDGLATGSDVRMSGIKIGTVTAQSLNKDNYFAVVTFNLTDEVQLPTDSSAKIIPAKVCWAATMSPSRQVDRRKCWRAAMRFNSRKARLI